PAFAFIAGLATLTALLFYVTTADSAALVMANLSSNLRNPQEDGRAGLRIFWAMATGALPIAMLLVGGIRALPHATVLLGSRCASSGPWRPVPVRSRCSSSAASAHCRTRR